MGAKVDTAAGYQWTGVHTYLNNVTFDEPVVARDGFNNFLNPAARDAAIPAPIQGTMAFVRQNAGGTTINQFQYYNGSAWVANDGDITAITAGTGLTGGGTAGAITVSLDTTSQFVVPSQTGHSGKYLSTNGTTSSWQEIVTDPTPQIFLLMGA